MAAKKAFHIDLDQEFPHLDHAPIVEAVIHWRARATPHFPSSEMVDILRTRLPKYSKIQPQQEVQMQLHAGPEGSGATQTTRFQGFRFQTADDKQIAQFQRDGFAFSRLKPYDEWKHFEAEATNLWKLHAELTNPSEVQRLAVRFINVISEVRTNQLGSILALPPKSPTDMKLPVQGFMHQTRFEVPEHPYNINVIQTVQPASAAAEKGDTLIIDIDVSTTHPLPTEDTILSKRLAEMRCLKNMAFFALVKKRALDRFMED